MGLDAPRFRILPVIVLLLAVVCLILAVPDASTEGLASSTSTPIGNGSLISP